MENFLYFNPSYKITEYQYSQTFGVKIDTKDNTYYLRCNPAQGDYEFYCFCYNTEMLKTELAQNLPQSKPHKRQEAR